MPPLRVAFTLEQCWHRVPGGTAVAGIEMARALSERDDVELAGISAFHLRPPGDEWVPPLKVEQLPLPRLALYETWMRYRSPRVERATGRVDLIHATTIALPPKTAPLAVTIHDLAFLADPSHFTARGLRFFNKNLEIALREADVVFCSSNAVVQDALAAGFERTRLRKVPLGVGQEQIAPERAREVAASFGLPERFVLWSGTLEPRKNLRALLQAFRLKELGVPLVLAGPDGWNEDLTAELEALGSRVHALGFVPRGHLDALYAAATAFCFPSLREGFGFPVLEAMVQGTPVVTSEGTSMAEIAGDTALLVDPADPAAIAEALERVLGDGELTANMASRGRDRAAGFTWARTASLLVEAYRDMTDDNG